MNDHDFSPFIRILGRGKKASRPLTLDEAQAAMGMILDKKVTPEQLGAFLMLMRVKEEMPEELAGMVLAARKRLPRPQIMPKIDIDWSSYAGKHRQLPWFILSIILLAQNGYKTLLHGTAGRKDDRLYAPAIVNCLQLPASQSLDEVGHSLDHFNFAFIDLNHFYPYLNELIQLRVLLGLRSPINSLVRMLNPLNAPYSMQGIFHPRFAEIHQLASHLVGQPHMAVFRGEGGEVERNPERSCETYTVDHGSVSTETWPAINKHHQARQQTLQLEQLMRVWQGEEAHPYGEAATISTTAIALKLMVKGSSQQAALALAKSFWDNRCKESLLIKTN